MKKKHSILYIACLCSQKVEEQLLDIDPNGVGLQIQKYHRLLSRGLNHNNGNVQILSYQKGIEKLNLDSDEEDGDGLVYHYLKRNSFGYLGLIAKSFLYTFNFLKTNPGASVICDVLNVSISFGAALAVRLRRRKIIGIITDFPEQMSGRKTMFGRLVWKLISLCTGYVVLTSQMKSKLNSKKPVIVLEGQVDSKMGEISNDIDKKYSSKVCIYAGLLHKKYGIDRLIKAFCALMNQDVELHIYGEGDYSTEIRKIQDKRIKYYGIVSNKEVVLEEQKATLLINPRPSNEEFTKYSFPSKNMEYMASGTPLLTTILPGMPEEYLKYVYVFNDESITGMTKTMCEILSKSPRELFDKGCEAKRFVVNEKNEIVQAEKLIKELL